MSNWKVHSVCIQTVLQVAETLGASSENLLKASGINNATLTDPDATHPLEQFLALYDLAAKRTHTPDIGILSGRVTYISRINVQLYCSTISRTFREYLNLIPTLQNFMGDTGELKIAREDNLIRLDWLPVDASTSTQRYLSDEILTLSAMIFNSICAHPIPVVKAHFSYSEPEDLSLLTSVFGSNLHFEQAVSCFYCDSACLDYALTQLNTDWNPVVGQSLEHLFQGDEFIGEVQRSILRLLPMGEATIDRAAFELHISGRTLQRRLKERDTQFLQVLQELRVELAVQYLADRHLSITDIAFFLGYSDHRSFSGAFKSWYGKSPSEYRQQHFSTT